MEELKKHVRETLVVLREILMEGDKKVKINDESVDMIVTRIIENRNGAK